MKSGRRHLFLEMLLLCLIGSAVFAADGGLSSAFSIGAGARSLGMGGGFTALANDASTVYYNPAGLPELDYQEVSLMHVVLFDKSIYDVATWVYPLTEHTGLGVGFMRLGTIDITRRVDFIDQGTFNYATWQFLLSYGRRFGGRFSAGFSVKIASETIDNLSDFGIGGDFGVRAGIYRGLSAGVMLRDILQPRFKLDSLVESTPRSIAAGLAYDRLKLGGSLLLTPSLDVEKYTHQQAKVRGGIELTAYQNYSIRAGYDRDNFAFGAGCRIGRIQADYAYKIIDFVEDSHRFSISILLGESMTDQQARLAREEQQRSKVLLADERRRQFLTFKQRADSLYKQIQLDSALTYYQRALAFDEGNQEIIGTIAAIQNVQRIRQEQQTKIQEAQADLTRSINTYYDQANLFYEKKYFSAARDLLDLIFDIDPENDRAKGLEKRINDAVASEIATSLQTAHDAEQSGRTLEAIEAYNRILDLDPSNQAIKQARAQAVARLDIAKQLNLGIDLYQKGRLDEARDQFDAVLRVNPKEPVALEYLQKLGTKEVTAATLDDLQKDKDVWPLYLEGLRHMRNKEYQQAIGAWQKVLQAYPNQSNTLDNIKQAQLRMKSEQPQ